MVGTCGVTLAGGGTCTVLVEYTPVGLGGHSDTFNIDYNDGLVPQSSSRDVSGTGITPASLAISAVPDSFNYGNLVIGNTLNHTFTITNSGAAMATAMGGSMVTGTHYQYAGGSYPGGGTCGATLAGGGGTCTIIVQFVPGAASPLADTVQVSYNDGAAAQTATAGLNGTGQNPANISITESDPYGFGNVIQGNNATHIFTLNNSGDVAATGLGESGLAGDYSFYRWNFPRNWWKIVSMEGV